MEPTSSTPATDTETRRPYAAPALERHEDWEVVTGITSPTGV